MQATEHWGKTVIKVYIKMFKRYIYKSFKASMNLTKRSQGQASLEDLGAACNYYFRRN